MSSSLPNSVRTTVIAGIIGLFLTITYGYLFLPTNVGYIGYGIFLTLIVSILLFAKYQENKSSQIFLGFIIISSFLMLSMIISPIIFTRIDNAEYFDDLIKYTDDNELPFTNRINGSELRVVDKELASNIMDKSNPFGSSFAIYDIHLGNYQGKMYWIGSARFDGLIANDEKNKIDGFILVSTSDPTKEPIILDTDFHVSPSLIFNKNMNRKVWQYNINYLPGENSYFSYNDAEERMELIVPYAIKDSIFFGKSREYSGFVSSYVHLDGGVLVFGPDGNLIRDYSNNRLELPPHASLQMYSENWLERMIKFWGKSIVADHEVKWATILPWIKSERKLGVDDDVRVVINPDTFRPQQYILLDSTDSTNQILRGAIKANESGLFYYNFERYKFIDTNSAHSHIEETITNIRETSTHNYKALLPILYPVRENVTTLSDYAYVMPLQLGETRFGGIAITDPSDKTGTRTVVNFVESEQSANVTETVDQTIAEYLALIDEGTAPPPEENETMTGDFEVNDIRDYIEDGSTIYVMEGNFTVLNQSIQVVFSREYITNDEQWLEVVFTDIGDTINLQIQQIAEIYYAININ